MAARLRPNESIRHGAKRLIRKELAKALDGLENRLREDSDDLVHEVRKRLKRIRAVLRLIRAGIGSKKYRRENRRFRDIAAPLRNLRDAKVLTDECDNLLLKAQDGDLPQRDLQRIQSRLAEAHAAANQELFDVTIQSLRAARRKVRRLQVDRGGWSIVGKGVGRVYEAGYLAFHAAESDPSVENLHEWRKQGKYLQQQLDALTTLLGRGRRRLVAELQKLAHNLGDDHDLALLSQKVDATNMVCAAREQIVGTIHRRRAQLERRAFERGRRVYCKRPLSLLRSLNKSWHKRRARNSRP